MGLESYLNMNKAIEVNCYNECEVSIATINGQLTINHYSCEECSRRSIEEHGDPVKREWL